MSQAKRHRAMTVTGPNWEPLLSQWAGSHEWRVQVKAAMAALDIDSLEDFAEYFVEDSEVPQVPGLVSAW